MLITFKSHQVFEQIKPYIPSSDAIIVEAGAHIGHDTLRLATMFPHVTLHAFEPVPALFNKLITKTAHLPKIYCYPYALSDEVKECLLYIAEKPTNPGVPSQASSLRKPKERLRYSPIHFPYHIPIQTITLDAWAIKYGIKHIDFLWLDLQGHELNALQGCLNLLSTVQAIYLEVSFIEAYEGQPLYHTVQEWLQEHGFSIIAKNFDHDYTWFFGNALFIKKN